MPLNLIKNFVGNGISDFHVYSFFINFLGEYCLLFYNICILFSFISLMSIGRTGGKCCWTVVAGNDRKNIG